MPENPQLSPGLPSLTDPIQDWTFAMTRLVKLCSAVLCLALLGACATAQQRGVAGNAYVSTTRPAIAVHVKDLPPVTSGRGTGTLYRPNAMGALTLTVRTAVFGNEKALALVTHAELPNPTWIWTTVYARPGGSQVTTEVIDGASFAAFTYLVPMDNDPYAGLVGDPVEAPEEEGADAGKRGKDFRPHYWLARYLALRTNFNQDKIILEYREPAPGEWVDMTSVPFGMADELEAFEKRAREAFSLGLPSDVAGPVEGGYPTGVRWKFMSDAYLGDVMRQEPLSRF